MIWQRYRNELIVAAALLFALSAFFYKHAKRVEMAQSNQQMAKEFALLKETVSLKKIWGNKQIGKKVDALKNLVNPSKMVWQKKGRKLHMTLHDLTASEVNRVVTRILNIPVQVQKLKSEKTGNTYSMEIVCKW